MYAYHQFVMQPGWVAQDVAMAPTHMHRIFCIDSAGILVDSSGTGGSGSGGQGSGSGNGGDRPPRSSGGK